VAQLIESISDTARWVAAYRAQETERPDAVFKDPFARKLAGERGEAIVRSMRGGARAGWALVVRTKVLDDVIAGLVSKGEVDAVVNLAAGLDTRPWRMSLPAELPWVEVDLPGILDYKAAALDGQPPRCRYRAVRLDLSDVAARAELFAGLERELGRALVVTEGLLVYLTAAQVGSLATSLRERRGFRYWLFDLVNPVVLGTMQGLWNSTLMEGNAPMKFGPAEGTRFFEGYGWREKAFHSFLDASLALRREMPAPASWMVRLGMRLSWESRRERFRRYSGGALLEQA
jgi:methyltransferase (TIGR00027 family)